MKGVMIKMTILMGVTMSFFLSLVGTLLGGHFSLPGWLISFGISLVISLVIGFIVPVKKAGDAFCNKFGVVPESMKGNLLSGIISDLIYTPIITIIMVVVMISNAQKQLAAQGITEGVPTIGRALPLSLIVCLVVGYIIIIIVQPIFIKLLTKNMRGPQGPQS